MRLVIIFSLAVAALLLAAPQTAEAYIGPGAGISAIGTVIALIGAVLLAIVGFVWYPIKRGWIHRSSATPQLMNEGLGG